jgi:diguanylate cyclase (GGDEF)-like protein
MDSDPYAVVFIDLSGKKWDGIETLRSIWNYDSSIQAILCVSAEDTDWKNKVEVLQASDNYVILKEPYDSISIRQLTFSLTSKWEMKINSQMNGTSLDQLLKDRVSELHYQANHDMLTKLPNRSQIIDTLNNLIIEGKITKKKFAVFFFDLDRFKFINDALTHTIGDEVLMAVGERLKTAAVEHKGVVGRYGGDEFVLIIEDVSIDHDAELIAKKLIALFNKSFSIAGRNLNISTSIGISLYPKDGECARALLSRADTAMYSAKERSANSYQFYNDNLNVDILKRFDFENELSLAVEQGQFVLHYQPEFNLITGMLEGAEALMRWQHPERGLMMPEDFISIAEETGMIVPMGEWALRAACKQTKLWQEQKFPHMRLAVNVAGLQFEHPGFVDLVKSILLDSGLDASYLELEITENVIIKNNKIVDTVHELKKLGTKIALDDFGSGYSNISYLKQLPIDRLKIDRTYIQNIRANEKDEAIIRAVISMANSFKLQVLAEGVETLEQLKFLKDEQCHEAQGFYFSKPLTHLEFEDFMRSYVAPSDGDAEIKK